MAQLKGNNFIGGMSNLSFYTAKGSDKVIVRTKGGPSRRKVKTSPVFVNTRRVNAEFGGCSTAARHIRLILDAHRSVIDYNISGPLTALLKPIQQLDTKNDYGQRSICISSNPRLLEGFNLNRRTSFDGVVINPCKYEIDKQALTAKVEIPALLPGINFMVQGTFSFYRITTALGILPDFYYRAGGYRPQGEYSYLASADSEWYPVQNGSPELSLITNLNTPVPGDPFTLLLSVGLTFGTMQANGIMRDINYVGCGKIVGTR